MDCQHSFSTRVPFPKPTCRCGSKRVASIGGPKE